MRTAFFRKVRRSLAIALGAEARGIPTREAIERADEAARERVSRRNFLGTTGVVLAAGAAGCALEATGGAGAALKVGGSVGVVGAGMAGLSCADTLAFRGIEASVYEASDRVGGRVFSLGGRFAGPVSFGSQVVERGGELIDTTHGTMRGY